MNIIFQKIFLVLLNIGNNMKENEVIAIMCPHCGDVWKISIEDYYKNKEFYLINETDCWKCGKKYTPIHKVKIMDDFVYEALKTVKM